MRSVIRSFLRHLARRKSLSVLQLLGIAFGVAAAVGMTLASRSALQSLVGAIDFLRGGTTHTIERPAGAMEEKTLAGIMADPAVKYFAPVIDRRVEIARGQEVRIIGIDPFLDRQVRSITAQIAVERDKDVLEGPFSSFLFDPVAVLVDENIARSLRLEPDTLFETTKGFFRAVHIFPNPSDEPLIIIDIGHAQKLFDMEGRIDRVDLIITEENSFRARWEKNFRVESNRQHDETLSALLRAFRLNLQALSLFALFVGIFLIYNTAMFAVVSRRRDAGILLSIGASRREIAVAFIIEVLFLGAAGGAFGGVLGYVLSGLLVTVVGDTISSLYVSLRPSVLPWSFWNLAGGIFLGVAASIVGSVPPLIELSRVEPIKALRGRAPSRGAPSRMRAIALFGCASMISATVLFLFSPLHVYVGFAGAFAFLLGSALFSGFVIVALVPIMKCFFSSVMGLSGKVAIGSIRENLGRTSVAIAAFMVALSMSIGMSSMIDSFRESLVWWMNGQLRGELYISAKGQAEVPGDLYEEFKSIPGIGGIDVFRNVRITFRDKPAYITSIDASVLQRYGRFGWFEGGSENWEPVKRGSVIVSESFSRRFNIGKGDRITIQSVDGPVSLPVTAVFYDYTTEHGLIMMDRSTYLRLFHDRTINSLGIFIDKEAPEQQKLMDKIRLKASARGLPVTTRDELHEKILSLFDSTFAVTRSMRLLAVVVAFFGITGALMTLFVERQKEFGIYRSLGFTTGQVAFMALIESIGMGLISFLMSTIVGTGFALVLIKIINLESFNWTIFYHFTIQPYFVTMLTALAASIAASFYPVWSVLHRYPVMQIREE